MLTALLIIVIITILNYLLSRYLNDMSIESLKVSSLTSVSKKQTNVLFIYPHPDDEVMNAAGLISKMTTNKNFNVFVVSTTHGEHGDEFLKLSPDKLAEVRRSEFINVMKILKVSNWEMWNYPDGQMQDHEQKLKIQLLEFIEHKEIDLIVTYEKSGLYGHPDHISLSKSVFEAAALKRLKVLYSTLPDRILERINLPKTLTYKDKVVPLTIDSIANPTLRLNIFNQLFVKYLSAKQYKSQSVSKVLMKWIAMLILVPFEYYTTRYE